MKGRKIFTMHKSKCVILPKKLFKSGILDENKRIQFTLLPDNKILIEQKKNNGG